MVERIPIADLTERYFFADLAAGRKPQSLKKVRSRQAIVGIAPYFFHNRRLLLVLHAWAGRLPTSKFKDEIFKVGEIWRPTLFGIENNAMQSLFADVLVDESKTRKVKLKLIPITQPTNIDKQWKIRTTLQPEIANNNLFFLKTQTEAITEIIGFPTASTEDIIDAIASIIYHMIPKKATKAQEEGEKEALAEYMREKGHPASEIQRRLGR